MGLRHRGRRRAMLLAPLLLIGAGLAACGDDGDPGGSTLDEPTTVTIGFIGPLTGPTAPAMKPLEDGARAAVEYLNSGKATAPNVTYRLESRDSAADPNRAAVLVRELIDAGARMVIGDVGSAPGFIAEQTVFNREKVIGFTTTPSDSIWKDAGADKAYPWAFGISGDDTMFVTPLYENAVERSENGKIGQIYYDAGTVPGWAELTRNLAKADGVDLPTEAFAPTATDVKSQLRSLQDKGVDTVIVWAFGTAIQTVLTNLDQLGWYPNVVALPDAGRDSVVQAVPEKVMEKVVAGPIASTFASEDGSAPTGIVGEFLAALSKVTGRGPGQYGQIDITGSYTFDVILAYDAAIAKAGSTDPAAVREALESGMKVEGAMGVHTWSPEDRTGFEATSFAMFDPRKPCVNGTCVLAS